MLRDLCCQYYTGAGSQANIRIGALSHNVNRTKRVVNFLDTLKNPPPENAPFHPCPNLNNKTSQQIHSGHHEHKSNLSHQKINECSVHFSDTSADKNPQERSSTENALTSKNEGEMEDDMARGKNASFKKLVNKIKYVKWMGAKEWRWDPVKGAL